MSVWARLFGRSEQKPATGQPRLGLESLEAREVPAFVGGWGASSYQYAFNDPAHVADDVIVDGRIITAENFDTAGIAVGGYIRIKKLNSGG